MAITRGVGVPCVTVFTFQVTLRVRRMNWGPEIRSVLRSAKRWPQLVLSAPEHAACGTGGRGFDTRLRRDGEVAFAEMVNVVG